MTRWNKYVATGALTLAAMSSAVPYAGAQTGTAGTAQRPAGASASPSQGDSRQFINDAAVGGMAEVQLGEMAAKKAAHADVKAYGQMMVKDHTQANKELMAVAARLNVTPPTQLDAKHQAVADKLSKLEGAAFDREYTAAMVQGHEEMAALLKTRAGGASAPHSMATGSTGAPGSGSAATPAAGAGATAGAPAAGMAGGATGAASSTGAAGAMAAGQDSADHGLTQWATKTLPSVQQHLERAKALAAKVK